MLIGYILLIWLNPIVEYLCWPSLTPSLLPSLLSSLPSTLSPYFESVTNHLIFWVYWIMLAKIPAGKNTHRKTLFILTKITLRTTGDICPAFSNLFKISQPAHWFCCCCSLSNAGSALCCLVRVRWGSWVLGAACSALWKAWRVELALLTRLLQGSFPSVQMLAWNETPPYSDEIPNKCSDNTEHKGFIFFKSLAFTVNSIWIISHLHVNDSRTHYCELCFWKCTKQEKLVCKLHCRGSTELASNWENCFMSLHILYSRPGVLQENRNVFYFLI